MAPFDTLSMLRIIFQTVAFVDHRAGPELFAKRELWGGLQGTSVGRNLTSTLSFGFSPPLMFLDRCFDPDPTQWIKRTHQWAWCHKLRSAERGVRVTSACALGCPELQSNVMLRRSRMKGVRANEVFSPLKFLSCQRLEKWAWQKAGQETATCLYVM